MATAATVQSMGLAQLSQTRRQANQTCLDSVATEEALGFASRAFRVDRKPYSAVLLRASPSLED